ncbi:MAG: hypothetical protein M3Q75_00515 [Gemmatimonadota bacterium]|nr:hypothetical protein [Gemmatimonadota bacterium]
MIKIPLASWIANAAVGLTGLYGDVTRQAQVADCSRQTIYDHAHKVQAAVADAYDGGPTRATLIAQVHQLRSENARLWDWLAQTIEFPADKQHEFSVTAAAMGLSLNQVLVLLALILGQQACPGRSTLHRWIQLAAVAAGRALKLLDARCRALVLVGCLDEIFFHGRPVLVGVEPTSMAWFLGQKANDRSGATWAKALRDWPALSFVMADAGTGLQAGITAVQQERRETGQPALENGLDVFHTTYEARRVLRLSWNRVERLWEQAEIAGRRVEQSRRQGQDARGAAVASRCAWKKAEAAFAQYERCEAGWKMAHGALVVYRPKGRLNDRAWAEQQIAGALPLLSGREWSKVRNFLQTQETLTFLDRLHRQLGEAVPEASLRAELVRLWWLRRQRPRANSRGAVAGAGHVAHLVQQVVCQKVDANWRKSYQAVVRVLRLTVRASSAVECMNGVLRMHQSRHKTVNQGLLDLKRLYWNCRAFREGKRRGRCPYEHLGLKLPSYRFWDLLWMPIPAAAAI